MANVVPGRMTADWREPFVVFLIGMRINRPLRVDKWGPVFMAMPRMVRELEADRSLGFIGAHSWFGRTTMMLQYWESFEKLEAYAKAPEHKHLPAWRDFNRRARASDTVGIWHETYLAEPGRYEAIYVNMPPFGLGGVSSLIKAEGTREQARQRLRTSLEPAP
jgi:hypothetical protein